MAKKAKTCDHLDLASFFLRVGLATVFFYAAIASFLQPLNWIGFFPAWVRSFMPASILLFGYSFYQLGLGLWLLSGKKAFYAAILAGLTLVAIVITNIALLDIVFRDVAILFAAVALLFMHTREK
ncbi:MAG: hypothetical protein Q8R53_06440 [Nanoarchaeota archaeon]|nr:hypothetical protein [Nanoarchaeota archaeon]